ncbi:MAG TPA: hypothetical protein VN764_08115, partial [Polyangiaceae bacterium]|nr:hypothetical protein [Polyangiaceae bacterium]
MKYLTHLGSASLLLLSLGVACSVNFDGLTYDGDDSDSGDGGTDGNPDLCVDFCDDAEDFCGFGTEQGYQDRDTCLEQCAGYTDEQLECRFVEMSGAESDPDTHCPGTLLDGGEACPDATPDPCTTFCDDSSAICPFGSELGYAARDECLSVCARLPQKAFDC